MPAQATPRTARPAIQPASRPRKFDQYVTTTDINGRPFKNVNEDVEGSPYFIKDPRYASITSSKGAVYENIKVKIDLNKQEAHLFSEDQKELVAEDGMIREIVLADSVEGGWVYYRFQTGFPSVDKNNGNYFYQVLSDGNIQLLKSSKKEIVETRDVMSGEVRKEFVEYDEYYISRDGEIKKLKKDKDFVLGSMKDQQEKMEEYLKDKKMNYKNMDMLMKLYDFYNSL